MSKLSEYAALIPKGFTKTPAIIGAIVNQARMELGWISAEDLDIIITRRMICAGCEYMSKNCPNYKTDRNDEHCIHCGCPITTRTANLKGNCGIESYNYSNKEKLKLKWESKKMYFNKFIK